MGIVATTTTFAYLNLKRRIDMEKQYKFNEFDVCTNPDILGEVGLFNQISVAQAPNGKWGYGISYQFDQADGSGGCWGVSLECCRYQSRREAVLEACQRIKIIADRQENTGEDTYEVTANGNKRKPCTCHDMRECVEKAYNEVSQQTLF